DWVQVSCGGYHTLAIKSDGSLWACGYNYYGQLGLGNSNNRNIFTRVGTESNWIQVSCGSSHTLAIKSDGSLWGCGWNELGQLGLGNSNVRSVFTRLDIRDIKKIFIFK
ncbi:MAG: hypothetical protein QXN52_09725, partial [Nitrososphaerota archaeon]